MKDHLRIRVAIAFAMFAAVPFAASIAHAGSSPFVQLVETMDCRAENGTCAPSAKNGHIDRIQVTFNQAMDSTQQPAAASAPGEPGFGVVGYEIVPPILWAGPTQLAINLVEQADYDTAATPVVTYTPGAGPADLKTAVGVTIEAWDTPATDRVGAYLTGVTAKDYGITNLFTHPGDELFLRFTEPVQIVGATPADRWASLERAVVFTLMPGGAACQDGIGVVTGRNFPRPQTATDDPILSPPAGERSSTVHVRFVTGNEASTPEHRVTGIPVGCKVGIHDTHNTQIIDASNNAAIPLVTTAAKHFVHPADAAVTASLTADAAGTPDGLADAVQVTFDLPIDDATVEANLAAFSVSAGGASVPVVGFSTGSAANDTQIVLRLSEALPGGAAARVAYTRDASCAATASGSSGGGAKALIFPLGSAHRACVGAIDAAATDGVAPVILSAATRDADGNGILDGATVTFSEPIATGALDGWTIAGAGITDAAFSGTTATFTVTETGLGTGLSPAVGYVVPPTNQTVDAAGNPVREASVNAADGAAPRVTSVTVADGDTDGNVDSAIFSFTENVTAPAGSAAAFSIGGAPADAISAVSGSSVTVHVPGLTGSHARAAAFDPAAGAVTDAAGNAPAARTVAAGDVIDAAAPVASIEISPNAPVGQGTTTIRAIFSEGMDASAPVVTFAGRSVSGAWTSTPSTWEGTIEIAEGDCTVATGCAVDAIVDGAKDARLNAQAAPVTRTTEIDTIAPVAPGSFTFGVSPDAPAGYVNAQTTGITLGLTTGGDAAGGTAELLLDGVPFAAPATAVVSSDSLEVAKSFASTTELSEAIAEGAHALGIRLCDDARNCVSVTDAVSFTADLTPVAVQISTDIPDVVSGGGPFELAWNGNDTGDVTVSSSTDGGSTFATVASGQPADGATAWGVPAIDTAGALLRLVSTDAAGNTFTYTTDPFTIDSTAPVVGLTAPASRSPFLGSATAVRWTATDISDVAVAIEYTTNGTTWTPINGGAYSSSNDGLESWAVPNVRSFDVRVRVRGTDETGRSTTATSGLLASGVRGFVADRSGAVYGYGASSTSVRETLRSSTDVVRGLAVRSDDRSGYVLHRDGRVYPFAETGAAMPPSRSATRFRGDLARGIALRNDITGYVVDAYGRVYPFGGAPRVTVSRTWVGSDLARAIVLRSDKRGGYVLDAYGRLHPFRIGSYAWPPRIQSRTISSKRAVSVALRRGDRSGYILEHTGRILRFGGAPAVSNPYVSSSAGARSLIAVTDGGGYWVDGRGTLRRYGEAFGSPSKVTFSRGRARGGN